jgi:hypothetical protein
MDPSLGAYVRKRTDDQRHYAYKKSIAMVQSGGSVRRYQMSVLAVAVSIRARPSRAKLRGRGDAFPVRHDPPRGGGQPEDFR